MQCSSDYKLGPESIPKPNPNLPCPVLCPHTYRVPYSPESITKHHTSVIQGSHEVIISDGSSYKAGYYHQYNKLSITQIFFTTFGEKGSKN